MDDPVFFIKGFPMGMPEKKDRPFGEIHIERAMLHMDVLSDAGKSEFSLLRKFDSKFHLIPIRVVAIPRDGEDWNRKRANEPRQKNGV